MKGGAQAMLKATFFLPSPNVGHGTHAQALSWALEKQGWEESLLWSSLRQTFEAIRCGLKSCLCH